MSDKTGSDFRSPPVSDHDAAVVEGKTAVTPASLSVPFSGAVPRVEPKQSHRQFVEYARPNQVMCKIIHARQLLKRGETAESYFPDDVDVITTTTVRDTKLHALPWEDNGYRMGELEIVRQFGPDYHIPTDYSAYVEHPEDKRRELQKRCMKGTIWMDEKLSDTETSIIPLFKGVKPESREICYRTWDHIDADMGAYYAVTYFTRKGRRTDQLVHDLEVVAGETDTPLFLVGLLSPRTLGRLPDNVIATAGQKQWRERVTPTQSDPQQVRAEYEALKAEVLDAMGLAHGFNAPTDPGQTSLSDTEISEQAPH